MTAIDRFYAKTKRADNGCLEWTGCKLPKGYGKVGYQYRTWLAHRLAWFFEYGELDDKAVVMHSCDNPSCVDVKHLSIGTTSMNAQDCAAKGRTRGWWSTPGAEHPNKGKSHRGRGVEWTEKRRAKCQGDRCTCGAAHQEI